VTDLAKFASWQFKLLANQSSASSEVLAANTLREMHRVHWVDEDWETSWGLGFVVANADGNTLVGHGGVCPGYITGIEMVPKKKLAVVVLTNAGDGPASSIAINMLKTIGPALQAAASATPAKTTNVKDLSAYEGNYGGSVWGGEFALRVWGDKLVMLRLPSDAIKDLTKLKHVADDIFVRLSKQDDERENWIFQRDANGQVSGVRRHSQVYQRLN
jgi:CubicO group peptidase (beta-lactamase class C family)